MFWTDHKLACQVSICSTIKPTMSGPQTPHRLQSVAALLLNGSKLALWGQNGPKTAYNHPRSHLTPVAKAYAVVTNHKRNVEDLVSGPERRSGPSHSRSVALICAFCLRGRGGGGGGVAGEVQNLALSGHFCRRLAPMVHAHKAQCACYAK